MKPCSRSFVSFFTTLVALLLCGCQQPSARISPRPDYDLKHRATTLLKRAARGTDGVARANAIEALVNLAPDDNLALFREAVTDTAPLVRYAGCVALGQARDAASVKALRLLMNADPDRRVQLAAAYAAARCGYSSAGQIMADALDDSLDEKLRADAAFLIGELGEPKALTRLRLAAMREDSGYVAVHIESAMAKLGDAESLQKIVQYALKSDTVTVLLALQTLAEIADPSTKKTLEYRLGNRADYLQARLIAARGLGEMGDDAGYKLALNGLAFAAKEADETMQVRVNAALALGAIGKRAATPALQKLAENERDARTQIAACYAICRILKNSPGP